MLGRLFFVGVAIFACALPAPARQGQEIPPGVVEEEDGVLVLNFPAGEEEAITLQQLIGLAQRITGKNFTVFPGPGSDGGLTLQQDRIRVFGEKRIRKEDFYSFFQTLLRIHDFVCVPQGSGDLELIMITPINAATQPTIKSNVLHVPVDEVEDFADQPGLFIATVVPLRYANAQGLGTSLRSALSGGTTGQDAFMPLPTENALLIQQFGPFVASAVRMVRMLDVEPSEEGREAMADRRGFASRPPDREEGAGLPAARDEGVEAWAMMGAILALAGVVVLLLLGWRLERQRYAIRSLREELARLRQG